MKERRLKHLALASAMLTKSTLLHCVMTGIYQQTVANDIGGVCVQSTLMMLTNFAHGRRRAGIPGICLSKLEKVENVDTIALCHNRVYQQAIVVDKVRLQKETAELSSS